MSRATVTVDGLALRLALLVAACGQGAATDPRPPGARSDAAASAPVPAPAAPVDAPTAPDGVDPRIVALARRAATECRRPDDGYFDPRCDASKQWNQLALDRTHAATLVALLEDPLPDLWWLVTDRLYQTDWLVEDAALQARLLAVAAKLPKGTGGGAANKLGRVIGFFDFGKTGLFDRAKAIVDDAGADPALRVGIVNWILAGNPASEAAYALTRDQAMHGASPGIRAAALVALSAAYNQRATDEMCRLWIDALPALDDKPGAMVAAHLTNGDLQVDNQDDAFPYNWATIHSDDDKCPAATVDAALALIERRAAAGTARDAWWVFALRGPAASRNGTAAQRRKAIAIARRYADDTRMDAFARGYAMDVLVDLDRRAAAALAAKYARDPDPVLREASRRVRQRLAPAAR